MHKNHDFKLPIRKIMKMIEKIQEIMLSLAKANQVKQLEKVKAALRKEEMCLLWGISPSRLGLKNSSNQCAQE